MSRAIPGSLALAVTAVLAACPPPEEPVVDHEARIDQVRETYVAEFNRQDLAAVAALYTTDAIYIDADGTEVQGRNQIQRHFEQLAAEAPARLSATAVETAGDQRLGWQYGTYQLHMIEPMQPMQPGQPGQPGQPMEPGQPGQMQPGQPMQPVQGRYLIVLERDNDNWLIRAHMNNADMPVAPDMMPPDAVPPAQPPVDTPAVPPTDTPPELPADAPPQR